MNQGITINIKALTLNSAKEQAMGEFQKFYKDSDYEVEHPIFMGAEPETETFMDHGLVRTLVVCWRTKWGAEIRVRQ